MPESSSSQVCGETELTARASFPAELTSAGRAREFVSSACAEWAIDDVAATAKLVVTELVENAVQHARSRCDVWLVSDGETLTIAVGDPGQKMPRVMHPEGDQPGGRGLLLVSALARDWGYRATSTGKQVWASLPIG